MLVMLDLPQALEREAEEYSTARGTTLDRMLANWLENELHRNRRADDAVAEFDALLRQTTPRLKGAPYLFDRADAYKPGTPADSPTLSRP